LLIIIVNVLASELTHIALDKKMDTGLFVGSVLILAGFIGLIYFVRITIFKDDSEWLKHIFMLVLTFVIIKVAGSFLTSAVIFCINKLGLIDVNTSKIIMEKTSFIFHMIVNVVFLAWLIVRIDYDKALE
jgi:hypothetical protein